jgi:hypothetical protein
MKNSNRFFTIAATFVVACILFGQSNAYSQCATKCTSTTDYCQTGPTHGIFLCASTQVPSGASCASSCSTNTCHYIHLRNVTGCDNPRINKIEIEVTKDANSSEFQICNAYTQWGESPWTSQWTITTGGAPITSGNCYSWGGVSPRTFQFDPPAGSSPVYTITNLNHWMVTICGGASYTVKIFYDDGTDCTFNTTVTSNQCPPSCL